MSEIETKSYKAIYGEEIVPDVSPEACQAFGFLSGERVITHKEKPATIIGVAEGKG